MPQDCKTDSNLSDILKGGKSLLLECTNITSQTVWADNVANLLITPCLTSPKISKGILIKCFNGLKSVKSLT